MTKAELIAAVAEATKTTKVAASAAVEATFAAITATLAKGGEVRILGFGSFSVAERAARTGKAPRTGKAVEIPAARVPKFKAGKELKDAVKG